MAVTANPLLGSSHPNFVPVRNLCYRLKLGAKKNAKARYMPSLARVKPGTIKNATIMLFGF